MPHKRAAFATLPRQLIHGALEPDAGGTAPIDERRERPYSPTDHHVMLRFLRPSLIGAVVLVSGAISVDAARSTQVAGSPRGDVKSLLLPPDSSAGSFAGFTLRVSNVQLEAPPPDAPKPSAVLKFDLVNDSLVSVTDILLEVAVAEKSSAAADAAPRIVVGPFTVRGHATIEAGYTINYVLLLRNLAPDCECVARVRVVGAQALPHDVSASH